MSLIDNLKNIFKKEQTENPQYLDVVDKREKYQFSGLGYPRNKSLYDRRKSSKKQQNQFLGFIPRSKSYKRLDYSLMETKTSEQLLKILMDNHPDVSFAVWEFMRIGSSNFNVTAYKIRERGEKGQIEENKDAQYVLDEYIRNLKNPPITEFYQHGNSLEKIVDKMIQFCIIHGAVSCEIGFKDKDKLGDLFIVDPSSISFATTEKDGRIIPYQYQLNKGYVPLDIPSFIYEGLDEYGDNPYGRAPFQAVISTIFFQLQVLQDLRAVVHSQGYPRIDIKVLEETLMNNAPPQVRTHP
ncbi:MAG: hypothetical protein ACOCUI_05900, partial [bacterium]